MMDWLYDELDQNDSATFQAHVSTCSACGAELRSLQRTRDAFRQIDAEEPPAAVTARLLHEAARRAPAVAVAVEPGIAGGGIVTWLGKLFRPLTMHPAVAALASLLLVAGVAGSIWMNRGDDHVAQPEAAEATSETAAASHAAEPAPAADPGPAAAAETPPPPPSPTQTWGTEEGAAGQARDSEPDEDRAQGYLADVADAERQKDLARASQKQAPAGDKSRVTSQRMSISAREAQRGRANEDEDGVVANAVTGADPLIVDSDADDAQRGSGDSVSAALEAERRPASRARSREPEPEKKKENKAPEKNNFKLDQPSAVKVPAEPTTLGKSTPRSKKPPAAPADSAQRKLSETTVPKPAPSSAASPATRVDDSKQLEDGTVAARTTSSGEGGKFRPYREADLKWAKAQQRALNKAVKGKDCRRAAQIANDILDRNPDYYTSTVQNSRDLQRCRFYVSDERARRSRAMKGGKVGTEKAAPQRDEASEAAE